MRLNSSERARVRGGDLPTLGTFGPTYKVIVAVLSQAYCGHALVIHHLPIEFGALFMLGDTSEVARGEIDESLKKFQRHSSDVCY